MQSVPLRLRFGIRLAVLLVVSTWAAAQQHYVSPLITEPVEEGRRMVLKGNVHPLARAAFEVAAAPPNLPMERMLLVLKRSPEQETALVKLLDDQQDKSSPDYHKWVTPEQFGQQFGPADSDIQSVTSWLQGHGFRIAEVSKGRTVIEFSGTAAQVQETFHTAIHKYVVNGKAHWANASDPDIPAALAPVVAGVHSLHNFYAQPQLVISREKVRATVRLGTPPQVTFPGGSHGLLPADYAVIYNATPAFANGIVGAGQTIAVVARSNLFSGGQDIGDFRSAFGLSGGFFSIILNGPDPGDLGGGEEGEATLDGTWSTALAPQADVDFVVSAGTNSTDGIVLSESYIIDNNLAPVMTESFGGCEAVITSAEAQSISSMAEQAAAQGITYLVSTGDTGAEGCDNANTETVATGPVSVSPLASNPFVVAVGGTQFNENGHDSTFWNTANGVGGVSAKSYIPEDVWNESCTSAQCGTKANIGAGSGGASVFFSKPSWQSGVSGIPSDGARDLPDVSLTAASHDPYLLCIEGSCVPDGQGNILLAGASGTSASAPSFAGVMALVNQQTGSRQGQANYVLYRLAAVETLAQCNGSKTTALPAGTCVFNDVTVGNNAVPGEAGFGTPTAKYQSTVGYDLATGLGSVNVTNLVNRWSSIAFTATTSTLVLSPTSITHGSAANVSIHVSPSSGGGVPTGDVSLVTNATTPGAISFTLNGGAVSSTWDGLPGGTYLVNAHYAGDGTFAGSDSTPAMITVSPEGSTTTLSIFGFDASGNTIPFNTQPYGNAAYLRADISSLSGHGLATGQVSFTDSAGLVGTASLNSAGTAATAQGVFTIPAGHHSIVANYNGDPGLNASTSAAVDVTVTQAPTTAVVSSGSSTVTQGDSVELTAIVNTTSSGLAPSGTVTFLSGSTAIADAHNPVTVSGPNGSGSVQTGVFAAALGTANLITVLPAGQNVITAQYSGDTNYTGSISSATTVNVQANFAFVAAAPSITIASPGGSGTVMLTVTGQAGYSGTINFSAASCAGLPRESSCSFNPASITNSGSTTLTISTTAAHSSRLEGPGWWPTSLGATLAGIFLLGSGSRRRAWSRLLSLIAVAGLITIASCGGGGSSSSGGGNQDPGTPAGSSRVIVTATSGPFSNTAAVTLVIQ
jgi:subtilase family serine protease